MKNVYVLPTDKPSRLFYNVGGALLFTSYENNNGVNIYITSDEEIKPNKYCLINGVLCKTELLEGRIVSRQLIGGATMDICASEYSEIILTDNKDLIKDGVQPIDDKFLEWFVKNQSCEQVEVIKDLFQVNQNNAILKGSTALAEGYKIIIPKEEQKLINNCPKCGLDLVIRESCTPICTDIDCGGIVLSNETLREWALQKERQKQHLIDTMKRDEELGLYEEYKQETLEEVAEKYSKKSSSLVFQEAHKKDFIAGAMWQQERSYSEEDLRLAWEDGREFDYDHNGGEGGEFTGAESFDKWFENLKKKTQWKSKQQ